MRVAIGCTFAAHFVCDIGVATGSFNWATHVGAFKFDNCKPAVSNGDLARVHRMPPGCVRPAAYALR